jgi:hypothetical protein
MRKLFHIKQTLLFLPAPLFFIFGIVSWFTPNHQCSSGWIIPEMAIMWIVMGLAHVLPWIVHWERKKMGFARVITPNQ